MCNPNSSNCQKKDSDPTICGCSEHRVPRQLLPLILLILKGKDSYGYELIDKISEFRFHDSPPDVGAVYRNLRNMERRVGEIEMGHERDWPCKEDLPDHSAGRGDSARLGDYFAEEKRGPRPVPEPLPEPL
jgi:hypothetical protein